jgi:hypothetical protein
LPSVVLGATGYGDPSTVTATDGEAGGVDGTDGVEQPTRIAAVSARPTAGTVERYRLPAMGCPIILQHDVKRAGAVPPDLA